MIPNHTRPVTTQTVMRLCEICATPLMMMYVGAILMKLPHGATAFVLKHCGFACNPSNPTEACGLRPQCISFTTDDPHWWMIVMPDDLDSVACMQHLPKLIATAFEQHLNPFAMNEVIHRRAEERAVSWGFGRQPDAKEGG